MIIIGEKLNSSIKSVKNAIASHDEEFIKALAKNQQDAGANYLDVNTGMFLEDELPKLNWLMKIVLSASDLPLVIDTPNPNTAISIAKNYTGKKPIINSITLEQPRFDKMLEAAKICSGGLIALCLDDKSASHEDHNILSIATKLVNKLVQKNMDESDIYIDPMISPLGSDGNSGINALKTIKQLHDTLPSVHIVCGLSNISFGLPKRPLINRTFLVSAMTAGLDCAIMDPMDKELMASLIAQSALLGQDEYCMNYISAYREELL